MLSPAKEAVDTLRSSRRKHLKLYINSPSKIYLLLGFRFYHDILFTVSTSFVLAGGAANATIISKLSFKRKTQI
jgi:hypothetical protein